MKHHHGTILSLIVIFKELAPFSVLTHREHSSSSWHPWAVDTYSSKHGDKCRCFSLRRRPDLQTTTGMTFHNMGNMSWDSFSASVQFLPVWLQRPYILGDGRRWRAWSLLWLQTGDDGTSGCRRGGEESSGSARLCHQSLRTSKPRLSHWWCVGVHWSAMKLNCKGLPGK